MGIINMTVCIIKDIWLKTKWLYRDDMLMKITTTMDNYSHDKKSTSKNVIFCNEEVFNFSWLKFYNVWKMIDISMKFKDVTTVNNK